MAEIGNTTVFSQTDASNNSGTVPTWAEGMAPSQVNDSARAFQGAVTREWNWRNATLTSTGVANAYVLTYGVAPAAYYNGQIFTFKTNFANTDTATLNVNLLGAKTIKKVVAGVLTALASGDVASGAFLMVAYNSADDSFVVLSGSGQSSASKTEVLTGTDTLKAVTPSALAALWEQGTDVASAATILFGSSGYFNITGTVAITDIDFGTDKAGRKVWVKFAGILTLTHNATTLILPGGANITTAAGDTACFVSEGADAVRCVSYNRANGTPVAGAATQAEMEAASSTAVFSTPGRQHSHPGHPKFWAYVTVAAGTPTLQASYNVTSITDTAVGRLTVTIGTDFSSANWAPFVTVGETGNEAGKYTSVAAGSVEARNETGGGTPVDPDSWSVMGLGDQ